MNIHIVCIGKLKEKYWQDAAAEYIKRLSRFCKLSVTELSESKSDSKEEESEEILGHIPKGSYVIALDIGGKRLSSEGFAEKISELALSGSSDICFIIGGSNGFDDRVRKTADMRLSFSDFTFPHQLMRVILLEQIYRAFKIINNEKYHK
ncbi:MAG: 23S rRNA (pseudouridine(1915)-N(3))-methyltransferase RlmH [Firmicutes bacterium]|nr:23S rRNA (pseudouridine(1915)-N(3))-methyltransferase RlmH [Bacillota bacterium]